MDERKNEYETKTAERKELQLKTQELDKKFESAKLKRCLLTIAFYAVVYTGIFCNFFLEEIVVGKIVGIVMGSIFLAGITFWINAMIFSHLVNKGDAETKIIASMEKRLSEIDEELDELRKEYNHSRN